MIRLEREERLEYCEEIKRTIGDKIEQIAEENGQITRPAVRKLFSDFSLKFETTITNKIDSVLQSVVAQTGGIGISAGESGGMNFRNGQDNYNTTMEIATGHTL